MGGGGASELFRWLRTRARGKQTAEGAAQVLARQLTDQAMSSAGGQLTRLEGEISDLRQAMHAQDDRHREEMAAMEARHGHEMAALKAKHTECEEGQALLREEIDRLMRAPIPDYKPADLRRVRTSRRRPAKAAKAKAPKS